MRLRTPICCAIAALSLTTAALAQQGPPPGGPDNNGGPPAGGGPGMGGGGMGRGGMLRPADALGRFIGVLADENLKPDFTLGAEQKQKIQSVRDAFKAKQEAWRAEHAEDFKKLQEQLEDLRGQGQDASPEDRRAYMDAQRELMSTGPNGEDEVKQVKAVLTEDQAKQVEKKLAEPPPQNDRGGWGGGRGQR